MADVFPVDVYTDDESANLIVDDDGIILESFAGDKIAYYALHAINSHDELVSQIDELLAALELAEEAVRAKHSPGVGNMVPDGWQLVPVEPTSAMLIAAGAATPRYRAMLAAAPKPVGE